MLKTLQMPENLHRDKKQKQKKKSSNVWIGSSIFFYQSNYGKLDI